MRILRARLFELERARQDAEHAAARKAQVGSGERAEKIRTYNFAESRVTDHRIKLTQHRLGQILEGGRAECTESLISENRRRALEECRSATCSRPRRTSSAVPGCRRRVSTRSGSW